MNKKQFQFVKSARGSIILIGETFWAGRLAFVPLTDEEADVFITNVEKREATAGRRLTPKEVANIFDGAS